jgi:hypothetical protein
MEWTSPDLWTIQASQGSHTRKISVRNRVHWRAVYAGALEVHGVSSCSELPGTGETFNKFQIYLLPGFESVTPRWKPKIDHRICHDAVDITNNGTNTSSVKLAY